MTVRLKVPNQWGPLRVTQRDGIGSVYERHRVQIANPSVHGGTDSASALTNPTKLDDVLVAYFDAIAALSTTAPDGESGGAVTLRHRHGFR